MTNFPDLYREYAKICKLSVPRCLQDFDSFFELVRQTRLASLICENEFDDTGDRLRLCKNLHLTPAIIETQVIDRDAVLFIFTCKKNDPANQIRKEGLGLDSLPIPAFVSTVHGCTVAAPLLPISELVGIKIAHRLHILLTWRIRRARRQGSRLTLAQELKRLREAGIFGESSLTGLVSLFFGIYGQPNAQLS